MSCIYLKHLSSFYDFSLVLQFLIEQFQVEPAHRTMVAGLEIELGALPM